MNSTQIEYFLRAASCLNFSQVAEEFYTTQPTVSRQIAALEKEFGFKLFERENNVLRLTGAGAVMSFELRSMRDSLNRALGKAKAAGRKKRQKLKIGFLNGIQKNKYVYPVLNAYSKAVPETEFSLSSESFSVLREKLFNGEYDLIFTYNFDLLPLQRISFRNCFPVNSGFLISRNNPIARHEPLSYRDFNGATFLLMGPEESPGRDAEMFEICSVLGISDFSIAHASNIDEVLYRVSSGNEAAVISQAQGCSEDPEFLFYVYPRAGSATFLSWGWLNTNSNPAVSRFADFITDFGSGADFGDPFLPQKFV